MFFPLNQSCSKDRLSRGYLPLFVVLLLVMLFCFPLEARASFPRGKEASVERDPFQKPRLFNDLESSQSPLLSLNRIENGRYIQRYQSGVKAVYTLDPGLQKKMKDFLEKKKVPYGVFVAMNPNNGKVLAMVEHSTRDPSARRLALRATYPAASIFKVITASALIEERGFRPESPVIRGNRFHSSPTTLAGAFAASDNVAFQSMALRYLNIGTLTEYARRFQFDRNIPFELPVDVSRIHRKHKNNQEELASLASGFGDVGLSPIHAAMIGSAIANEGRIVKPCVVDYVLDPAGRRAFECRPKVTGMAVSEQTADQLLQMMEGTIVYGTARRAFRRAHDHPALQSVAIGGKTGSLNGHNPPGHVTWFVGVAPLTNPEVVVSAVVVNSLSGPWKVKAANVAQEGFAAYFQSRRSTHLARAVGHGVRF